MCRRAARSWLPLRTGTARADPTVSSTGAAFQLPIVSSASCRLPAIVPLSVCADRAARAIYALAFLLSHSKMTVAMMARVITSVTVFVSTASASRPRPPATTDRQRFNLLTTTTCLTRSLFHSLKGALRSAVSSRGTDVRRYSQGRRKAVGLELEDLFGPTMSFSRWRPRSLREAPTGVGSRTRPAWLRARSPIGSQTASLVDHSVLRTLKAGCERHEPVQIVWTRSLAAARSGSTTPHRRGFRSVCHFVSSRFVNPSCQHYVVFVVT